MGPKTLFSSEEHMSKYFSNREICACVFWRENGRSWFGGLLSKWRFGARANHRMITKGAQYIVVIKPKPAYLLHIRRVSSCVTHMDIKPDWIPTAQAINVLPEPIRQYIHELETIYDPSGDIRELYRLRIENKLLRLECENLAKRVSTHENDQQTAP